MIPCQIEYGTQAIEFAIVRRNRKRMEIAVEPDMSVVVAAPLDATIEAIQAKVRRKAAWVRRQQRFFALFFPRTPERFFIAGETHLYLGRHYRLKVIHDVQRNVKLTRGFIVVRTHFPKRAYVTQGLVEEWYKEPALAKFSERLEINLSRFPDQEYFRPTRLVVKELAQRWGSMSPGKRLLLNRRLIWASVDAIDYVITHELCHIAEPHHGSAFYGLLTQAMPDWEKRKEKLERVMA